MGKQRRYLPISGAEDREPQNDAMKEAREAAKRNAQLAKEREGERDEAVRARDAAEQSAAAMRAEIVQTHFAALGAPMGLVAHYAGEPTREGIEEFVKATLGDGWSPGAPPAGPPASTEDWQRYEQGTPPGVGIPPGARDELGDLHRKMNAELEAMTDLVSPKGHKPTDPEVGAFRDENRKLNDLHRQQAAAIERGYAKPDIPPSGGFGGRFDAPPWARKYETA